MKQRCLYVPLGQLPAGIPAPGRPAAPHNLSVSDPAISARPRRRPRKRFEISKLVGDNPSTTVPVQIPPTSRDPIWFSSSDSPALGAPMPPSTTLSSPTPGTEFSIAIQPGRQPANSYSLEPRATASLSRSSAHTTPSPRRTPTTPRGSCTRTSSWTSRGRSTG